MKQLLFLLPFLFILKYSTAQTGMTKESIQVWGNCGMCKATIERAAKQAGAKTAVWDEKENMLTVSYTGTQTSSEKIQKAVAQSGYDTRDFSAPNEVYQKLHGCCQYTRKEETTAMTNSTGSMLVPTAFQAAPEAAQSETALLEQYYAIKNALVNSNAEQAAAAARKFLEHLDAAAKDQNLSAKEQAAFQSWKSKMAVDAGKIAQTTPIEQQRALFNNFSNNVFEWLKQSGASSAPVYQQYCTMKKAYWLSAESTIENPYYGKKMLNCGKVTEKL